MPRVRCDIYSPRDPNIPVSLCQLLLANGHIKLSLCLSLLHPHTQKHPLTCLQQSSLQLPLNVAKPHFKALQRTIFHLSIHGRTSLITESKRGEREQENKNLLGVRSTAPSDLWFFQDPITNIDTYYAFCRHLIISGE